MKEGVTSGPTGPGDVVPEYRMNVDKFTLKFTGPDAQLERLFLESYSFRSLTFIRFAIIMGVLLIGIFGFLDSYLLPERAYLLWFIRYGVLCPVALLIALSTYRSSLVRFLPFLQILMLILTASGFTVMIMISPPPVNSLYYSGIILVLMYGYTFLRLRFVWGTLAGWIIVGIYFAAAAAVANIPTVIIINNLSFLISANVIGMFSSYSIEYHARNDFFLMTMLRQAQQKITETNRQLGSLVLERTAELQQSVEQLQKENAERKQAERSLQRREEEYRMLFESINDAVFISELSDAGDIGPFFRVNDIACALTGYSREELLTLTLYDVISEQERDRLRSVIQNAESRKKAIVETENRTKNGRTIPVEISTTEMEFNNKKFLISTVRDITERKTSEQALRHAQKLESIGTLAGGIAHDFNNLMNGVLGQSALALQKIPKESPAADNIRKAIKASERVAELTKQLLAYSGRGKFHIVDIDLNSLVKENIQLLEVSIPKSTILEVDFGSPSPHIMGDISQLQQVIMNLIINAGEAMGVNPGRIIIRTSTIRIEEGCSTYSHYTGTKIDAGMYAVLRVQDTGSGMSRETLSKIFDPFFTTKFTGRGLGLAAVLGIIKGHKGGLIIESSERIGTTFEIIFPQVLFAAGEEETVAAPSPLMNVHKSTVLVIDDEQIAVELIEDILSEFDIRVIGAVDPMDGIDYYRANVRNISLVVLDYSMPVMDGKEVFHELKRINPDVKVLLSSGYSEEETMSIFW
jgi:PAS domain S-box-containing protein